MDALQLALARAKLMRGKGQKDEALQYLDKLHTEYDANGLSANAGVVIPYSSSNIVLSHPSVSPPANSPSFRSPLYGAMCLLIRPLAQRAGER